MTTGPTREEEMAAERKREEEARKARAAILEAEREKKAAEVPPKIEPSVVPEKPYVPPSEIERAREERARRTREIAAAKAREEEARRAKAKAAAEARMAAERAEFERVRKARIETLAKAKAEEETKKVAEVPMLELTTAELETYQALSGEEKLKQQIEWGVVQEGSIYISETEYLPGSVVKELEETAPDLHKILIDKGVEPYLAELDKIKIEYDEWQAKLKSGEIVHLYGETYMDKEDFEEIKKTSPELFKILIDPARGYKAYTAEIKKQVAEFEASIKEMPAGYWTAYKKGGVEGYTAYFKAHNTKVPGLDAEGNEQWVKNTILAKMKADSPEMYSALMADGFAAVDELVAKQQALIDEQRANLAKLDDYKITSFSEDKLKKEIAQLTSLYAVDDIRKKRDEIAVGKGGDITTYDVAGYLLKHPGDIATPIAAGFDKAYIISLSKAVKATKKFWVEGRLQAYEAYLAEVDPKHIEILTGLTETEIKGLRMPLAEFLERYETAHPIEPEKISWLPLYGDPAGEALRKEAYAAYKKVYGEAAFKAAKATQIATVLFAPARVLEPRVGLRDIKPLEWGIGAAQVILYASPLWLPRLLKLTPKLNPVGRVRVTMADGSKATVWKGVKFWDTPVIGKSGNRLILGTRSMRYPELLKISPGWKPVTGLETKIMASRNAMLRMGFADTDIARVMSTLQARGSFMGQTSRYVTRDMLTDPIKTLNKKSVEAIIKQASIEGKNIKVWYGSTSIKQQLAPKLRAWRIPADIDIQTTLNLDDTISLTNRILAKLKLTQGAKNVRISAKSPTLIETLGIDGKWHHAVDIHALGDPAMSSMLAGEGAYGRLYAEPPITVKYGNANIKIMSLSESGVRKAGSILEWRAGEIAPAAHRTKDIIDYYVILQSYNGDDVANAWALAYGYDPTVLAAMAADTSATAISWMYVAPSASISPSTLVSMVPLLTLTSPALTSAALSMPVGSMPSTVPGELPSMITIRPSTISAELAASSKILPPASVASSEIISQAISQPIPVQSVPPSTPSSAVKSPVIPPSVVPSKVPSVAPSVATSPPSTIPSVVPSLATISPSISPSVPPSTLPTYPPSSPPVYLSEHKPPPPLIIPLPPEVKEVKRKEYPAGTIVWKQGAWWKIIPPPYTIKKPISSRLSPLGVAIMKGTPQETLTFLQGKVPLKDVSFDLGVVDGYIDVKKKTIIFKGGGLETDVGTRVISTKKGLSIPAEEPIESPVPIAFQIPTRGEPTKRKRRKKTTNPRHRRRAVTSQVALTRE